MQPETKFKLRVQKDLKALAESFPGWFIKTQEKSRRGVPDILACFTGRFVALELKKSDQEGPDPLQAWNLDRIREAGGFAISTNPEQWQVHLNMLSAFLYSAGKV